MEQNEQQNSQFNGWRDAKIDVTTPVAAVVDFLNIMNQRLILIEDQLTIKVNDGQNITLTQYWIDIQKQEHQKLMEEYKKQMEAQAKVEKPAEQPIEASDVQ